MHGKMMFRECKNCQIYFYCKKKGVKLKCEELIIISFLFKKEIMIVATIVIYLELDELKKRRF